jgi:hypothetical protein
MFGRNPNRIVRVIGFMTLGTCMLGKWQPVAPVPGAL